MVRWCIQFIAAQFFAKKNTRARLSGTYNSSDRSTTLVDCVNLTLVTSTKINSMV